MYSIETMAMRKAEKRSLGENRDEDAEKNK